MHVKLTIPLPSKTNLPNRDYPRGRSDTKALTASERLPSCLARARERPALYRFLIYRNLVLEKVNIGETKHFRTRMSQYCEMIRRLLLLLENKNRVLIEKHPFRLVQYFIARSLIAPHYRVILNWTYISTQLNKLAREKLERNEQYRIRGRLQPKHLIGGRWDGNFENQPMPNQNNWQSVHRRLAAFKGRRRSVVVPAHPEVFENFH